MDDYSEGDVIASREDQAYHGAAILGRGLEGYCQRQVLEKGLEWGAS